MTTSDAPLHACRDSCPEAARLGRLQRAEARYRALVEGSPDAALILDVEGRVTFSSPAMQHVFGYTPDDVEGLPALGFVHPEDRDRADRLLEQVLAGDGPDLAIELRLRAADGSWVWTEETVTNRLDDPDIHGLVVSIRDVSLRKAATDALAASELRFRAMVESAEEGIWVLDAAELTSFVNRRLCAMLEVPAEELMGRMPSAFVHPDDAQLLIDRSRRRRSGARERFECRFVSGTGRTVHVLVSAHPFLAPDGTFAGTQGLLTDITDLKLAQERLRRLAVRDELTGLPNRALLVEQLATMLDTSHRTGTLAAVVRVDLSRDRAVLHDTLGDGYEDDLVVALAERLVAGARTGDIVGRWSEDDLVVLCAGLVQTDVGEQLAQELLAELTTPLSLGGRVLVPTPAVGVAFGATEDPVTLLRHSSVAAHRAAREPSGGVVVFSLELQQQAGAELVLLDELRAALLADDQLELHYQPVVALRDQRAVGAEALVRWRHPVRGLLGADVFVPLAERTGLVRDLDRKVLELAADALAGWRLTGAVDDDFTVAVNVSGDHYGDPSLVDHVRDVLRTTGLPASCLVLEVTETALVTDVDAAGEVLQRLKDLGIGLAIDDFGTGYCSLTYLRRFPVGTLKIDRVFVNGIVDSQDDAAIVAATLSLAASVGMSCIAEGVETPEQLRALLDQGCELGQGYLWSPPVPADRLPDVLSFAPVQRAAPRRRPAARPVYAARVVEQVTRLREADASSETIAAALNRNGMRTGTGTRWHSASVRRMLQELDRRACPA